MMAATEPSTVSVFWWKMTGSGAHRPGIPAEWSCWNAR
jgi:hypothetical protein